MGPTLNTASSMNAYVIADRGTWLAFKNRGDLAILVEGDQKLFNQYGVMLVNPAKHAHVKKDLGRRSSTGSCRPKGRRRSRATRSAASSCSFRTTRAGYALLIEIALYILSTGQRILVRHGFRTAAS